MKDILPKRLKKGDILGMVCPANFIPPEHLSLFENTIEVLKGFGLKVVIGKSVKSKGKYGVSAGSADMRAGDINSMFADRKINAIWCAMGGDTANEVLDLLDYDLIKRNPKIFMGLSDNTVLINGIYRKTGLITFHGTDAKSGNKDEYFDSEFSHEQFKKVLMNGKIGEVDKVSVPKCIRSGHAKGRIYGANIKGLLKLAGTEYFPDLKDSILLLEGYNLSVKDSIYRMTQLKQMKIFDKVGAVVVGYIYSYEKEKQFYEGGKRVYFEDILLDITKDYSFPILKIREFGHKCPSTFLPIGGVGEVDAKEKSFRIVETFVR